MPTLENLVRHPRGDVRIGGVQGLLRLAPAKLRPLLEQGSAAGDRDLHREVLKGIPAGDPAEAAGLIRAVLNAGSYCAEQSLLLDAALRAGVRLGPEELLRVVGRDMGAFPKDEAMYARLTKQEGELAALVARTVTSPAVRGELTKYLFTLGQLNQEGPGLDGRPYLQQSDQWGGGRRRACACGVTKLTLKTSLRNYELECDFLLLDAGPPVFRAVIEQIGFASSFQETHGYYADAVGLATVTLPPGWQERLGPLKDEAGKTHAYCLEVHDTCVSKLMAGREKDFTFIKELLERGLADMKAFTSRAETMRDTPQIDALLP